MKDYCKLINEAFEKNKNIMYSTIESFGSYGKLI